MAEKKQENTFEKSLKEIEEIAKQLQDPQTELENAVELYEKGMKLAKEVDKTLSKLERRVEIVTSSYDDDSIITEEYK